MDTVTKRLYEGLFLVDSGQAASDWDGTNEAITRILAKNDVDVVSLRKWDDRKLAYDVEGKSRGTYILVYFNSGPLKISAIERDVQLSEQIMRVMILRTDNIRDLDIEKDTPVGMAEKQAAERVVQAAEKAAKAAEEAAEKSAQAAEPTEEVVEEPAEAVEVEQVEEAEEPAEETEDKTE